MMKMMQKKGMSPMDAKGSVLDELLSHMDGLDGEELKASMDPAASGVAPGVPAEGDEASGIAVIAEGDGSGDGAGAAGKMSPEEMEELIEAIRAKLGDSA